jgi:hypothetical protein
MTNVLKSRMVKRVPDALLAGQFIKPIQVTPNNVRKQTYGSAIMPCLSQAGSRCCQIGLGLPAPQSSMHTRFSAIGPHRCNIKNHWRKNQHLQNRNKSNIYAWNNWHADPIFPSLQEVDCDPFNRHGKNQSADQHYAISTDAWVNKPVWSPENNPAYAMDDPKNDAITQAGDKAMPPDAFPAVHAGEQRGLCNFPNIVQCHRNDEYRCEGPKQVDAIVLRSHWNRFIKRL